MVLGKVEADRLIGDYRRVLELLVSISAERSPVESQLLMALIEGGASSQLNRLANAASLRSYARRINSRILGSS